MTIESPATPATELAVRLSPNGVRTPGASSDRLTAMPVRDHCLAPERADAPLGEADRYGRMFDLPALEVDEALLHQIGAAGGFRTGASCTVTRGPRQVGRSSGSTSPTT